MKKKMKKKIDQQFLDWLDAPSFITPPGDYSDIYVYSKNRGAWVTPEPGEPSTPSSYVSVLEGMHTDHILGIEIIRRAPS